MRYTLIIIIIILALGNIVYWWPMNIAESKAHHDMQLSLDKLKRLSDIRSLELISMSDGTVTRDIFTPVHHENKMIKPIITFIEEPKIIKQEPINQEVQKHNSVDFISKYRLAGILIRNGNQFAYILDGVNTIIARSGEAISENIYVLRISDSNVTIKNTKTGATKQLVLGGD